MVCYVCSGYPQQLQPGKFFISIYRCQVSVSNNTNVYLYIRANRCNNATISSRAHRSNNANNYVQYSFNNADIFIRAHSVKQC